MGRSHSPTRCAKCQLFRELCLCGEVTVVRTNARVLVLMHARELPLTTNTVRLLQLALTEIEVLLRGVKGQNDPDLRPYLADSRFQPLVLFPSETATPLTEDFSRELEARGKRPLLIVPDGNWRQASKTTRRLAELQGVQHVTIPPGPLSEYVLRKEPRPECVSTFEAVSRTLAILERDADLNERLMRVFRMKMDRTLWARGKMKPEDVRGGVPQAAIDSFRLAGARSQLDFEESSEEDVDE